MSRVVGGEVGGVVGEVEDKVVRGVVGMVVGGVVGMVVGGVVAMVVGGVVAMVVGGVVGMVVGGVVAMVVGGVVGMVVGMVVGGAVRTLRWLMLITVTIFQVFKLSIERLHVERSLVFDAGQPNNYSIILLCCWFSNLVFSGSERARMEHKSIHL